MAWSADVSKVRKGDAAVMDIQPVELSSETLEWVSSVDELRDRVLSMFGIPAELLDENLRRYALLESVSTKRIRVSVFNEFVGKATRASK